MEYQVVSTYSLHKLVTTVNFLIKQGWQPIGGVSSVREEFKNGIQISYMQAMILK